MLSRIWRFRAFMPLLFAMFSLPAAAQNGSWVIKKSTWTSEDEIAFSQFVQALGRSGCATAQECFTSPANPFRFSDPPNTRFHADCADFPYMLRAYFAWKRGLPFSYALSIRMNPVPVDPTAPAGEKPKTDARYSELGNRVLERRDVVGGDRNKINFFREADRIADNVSSGTLRVGPDAPGPLSDFYSPKIQLGSIRPGTVIYDPNGHVAVVYDVLADGRILFFDAHPDMSITRGIFSSRFSRSIPAQGAGFKNFRPLYLAGARADSSGALKGGRIVLFKDAEIPDMSLEQYVGTKPDPTDWKKGTFEKNGQMLRFHEYVRAILATENISPVVEFEEALGELCRNFQERAASVDAAVKAGVHLRPHPGVLPRNIFGADGDWEAYSTPGRDTRLRMSFIELRENLLSRYEQWRRREFRDIKDPGPNFRDDLVAAFHRVNFACDISYMNSAGQRIPLSFELAIRRLLRLSFDPYHCPELRWGASHPTELATCPKDDLKMKFYEAEQSLRNKFARDWSAGADLNFDELMSGRWGSTDAPLINIRQDLESLPNQGATP